jgi:hypothetical protein
LFALLSIFIICDQGKSVSINKLVCSQYLLFATKPRAFPKRNWFALNIYYLRPSQEHFQKEICLLSIFIICDQGKSLPNGWTVDVSLLGGGAGGQE